MCPGCMVTRRGWALIHPIIAKQRRGREGHGTVLQDSFSAFERYTPVGTPKEIAAQLLEYVDAGLRFLT